MTSPATPDDLLAELDRLGLKISTISHPPAFTVEEGERHVGHLPGVHIKNLFLCDAKKKMWLVVAPWDRRIDLKALPNIIGAARLSPHQAALLAAVLPNPIDWHPDRPGPWTQDRAFTIEARLGGVTLGKGTPCP